MTMGKLSKKAKKNSLDEPAAVKEVKVETKPLVKAVADLPAAAAAAGDNGVAEKKKKKAAKKGNKENAEWSKHTTIAADAPTPEPVKETENAKQSKPSSKPAKTIKRTKIDDCVKAFSSLLSSKIKEEDAKLFEDGPKKVSLQICGIKVGADTDKYIFKSRLSHNPNLPDADVLLIVKDLERGIKSDHEGTLAHYKGILDKAGVDNIAEVMPLRQLRVEYKDFEAKRNLSNRFDKVLVDDRVIRLIPQFLGSAFYKKNKLPVQVSLTKKNLKDEISKCINTSLMPMKNHGADANIHIGHTQMKSAELSDNCETTVRALEEKYPGGWINVRSVHIRCDNISLPLYITDRKTSEVGKVESVNAIRRKAGTAVDELSTVPGAIVSVNIAGGIKVKREADPEWDAKVEGPQGGPLDMPLNKRIKTTARKTSSKDYENIKAEEQDVDDAAVGKEAEADDKPPRKETKKEKKEKKAEEKKRLEEQEESEDDMDDMEQEYMRKVAEEEEEIERKEKENMEKMGIPVPNDDEDEEDQEDDEDGDEDDDDESLADDDVEAENLLSDDDDDGADDDDNIVMNRADSDEEDEKELHLKQKAATKKENKKQKALLAQKSTKKAKNNKPEEKAGKKKNNLNEKKAKKLKEKKGKKEIKGKEKNVVKEGKIKKKKKF